MDGEILASAVSEAKEAYGQRILQDGKLWLIERLRNTRRRLPCQRLPPNERTP